MARAGSLNRYYRKRLRELGLTKVGRAQQNPRTMKLRPTVLARVFLGAALTIFASAALAQTPDTSSSTAPSPVQAPGSSTDSSTAASSTGGTSTNMPSEAEMMKMMMEMSKVNENHKLLAATEGNWNFTTKMWPNGDQTKKPDESKGTAVRKSAMGGRYVVMDITGKVPMPGPDGKVKEFDFQGQGIDGYDNARQKFVSTWRDSMTTGIMYMEGSYDPTTKSLTYTGDYQMAPGMKEQIRSVVKLTDKDHMTFEWYENRNGSEAKTMQIDYTRTGKGK